MKIRKFSIIAIAVAICAPGLALADMKTIARASEVMLSDFRAPAAENGIASFKACATCELQVVNVTPQTRYTINGKVVSLPDFRKRIALVQNRDKHVVVVKHHLESDVITSIAIYL